MGGKDEDDEKSPAPVDDESAAEQQQLPAASAAAAGSMPSTAPQSGKSLEGAVVFGGSDHKLHAAAVKVEAAGEEDQAAAQAATEEKLAAAAAAAAAAEATGDQSQDLPLNPESLSKVEAQELALSQSAAEAGILHKYLLESGQLVVWVTQKEIKLASRTLRTLPTRAMLSLAPTIVRGYEAALTTARVLAEPTTQASKSKRTKKHRHHHKHRHHPHKAHGDHHHHHHQSAHSQASDAPHQSKKPRAMPDGQFEDELQPLKPPAPADSSAELNDDDGDEPEVYESENNEESSSVASSSVAGANLGHFAAAFPSRIPSVSEEEDPAELYCSCAPPTKLILMIHGVGQLNQDSVSWREFFVD